MIEKRFQRGGVVTGACIVITLTLVAVLAPWIAPWDPAQLHPSLAFASPTPAFPLGTDNLGRDVLSRLMHGARWTLGVVCAATILIMSVGVVVGLIAGYYGGLIDDVLMRLVDALLAVPQLLLGLAIVGMLGPGLFSMLIGLSSIWWVSYARIVRGMVVGLRERPFVDAARALGASDPAIILRHVLPALLPSVSVLISIEIGELILAISGLSFLGLGAQPPIPEWGAMLSDGRSFFFSAPRLVILPGLAVTIAVFGFNLLGDSLRDALDPADAMHIAPPTLRLRRSS